MAKKTKAKRRGSSKAGRPRIEGERYANGRLKPRGPNETVVAKRRAGDAEAGEHPLDFALSQKWINERQHRDAMAYRSAYQYAHIGGPRMSSGSLAEVPESELPPLEVLIRNLSQIPDADITAAWDKFFGGGDEPALQRDDGKAMKTWKLLNLTLTAAERQQIFEVAVLGSWSFWMTRQASDHALGRQDQERKAALMGALGGVARALRPPRPPQARITAVPHRPSRRSATEVPVRYETADGEAVTPQSMHGRPFEVVVTQRRRG
jgi:hypothetical protein